MTGLTENFPDLTTYGYKISQELGRNREGGRITWKGVDLSTQATVVIKQFCFATTGSSWSGYQAYQKELEVLQKLDNSGIPRYLDSIETEDGFCLIQEYKDALNLSDCHEFTLTEIKQVILKILDILCYLQQQNPPILHRDLKPENILIDEGNVVYLIDFGFASLGGKEISPSSIFKGTPGFMPPEQAIQPTTASDLYSLGVTIICLLTKQNIAKIREYATTDNPYQLKFKPLLPPLNRKFISWLDKMVQPKVSRRFANAAEAKAALEPIDLNPTTTANIIEASIGTLDLKNDRSLALGATATVLLGTISVLALDFANHRIEKTIINIAIALIIAVVVTLTELAAAAIAIADKTAKTQAIVLAVAIPAVLVIASSLILGITAAVGMTAAIVIAEMVALAYTLLQHQPFTESSAKYSALEQRSLIALGQKVKLISWLSAVGVGIAFGLLLVTLI